MCDLICDVITCCACAEIWVKSARLIKLRLKTRTKRENVEIKTFLHKVPSRKLFWNSIHNFLR